MAAKETYNILIIEDNPGDAHLVRIYLKESSLKHELLHAKTFLDGIEIIEKQDIHLTLLDLSLPDMHGFKTLTTFLDKCPKMPVIVLTGLNDEVVGNQSVKAGAQDYLVKGQFDSNLLSRVIRYSLQRHRTQGKLEEYARNLQISERRFIEAQEMAKLGNWEVDIVTNEMSWSDEVYRIFELQPGGLSPTLSDYINYVHPDDRKTVEEAFEEAIKNGQLHILEYRIVIGGRSIKHIANQVKVFYDNITEKLFLAGAVQDITERKVSEKLIEEKNISDKMSKMREDVLKDMNFHIRTPLSSIVNLSYLLSNESPTPQQADYLAALRTSVDDLSMTANNMLNFSVLLSEEVELDESQFNATEFFQVMKRLIQIKTETKKINLIQEIDEEVPSNLIGDANKLNQIVYNLVDNAIKFAPIGGEVIMKIDCDEVNSKEVKLSFIIEDNGPGLDPALLRKLNNTDQLISASQTNEEKKKMGIPIAKRLIEAMGGTLKIKSKPGEGSEFRVQLPLKVGRMILEGQAIMPTIPLNIMLVEDHFLNQIATKKVLTTWSDFVTVTIAANGEKAIEKFNNERFDLILMDLQMPVMDGVEATRIIRETSKIPIIALTANSSSQEEKKCLELGMDDYLAKPFQPKELFTKILGALSKDDSLISS